jgi:hypothetical protein
MMLSLTLRQWHEVLIDKKPNLVAIRELQTTIRSLSRASSFYYDGSTVTSICLNDGDPDVLRSYPPDNRQQAAIKARTGNSIRAGSANSHK